MQLNESRGVSGFLRGTGIFSLVHCLFSLLSQINNSLFTGIWGPCSNSA